jgi:hypothetical protein
MKELGAFMLIANENTRLFILFSYFVRLFFFPQIYFFSYFLFLLLSSILLSLHTPDLVSWTETSSKAQKRNVMTGIISLELKLAAKGSVVILTVN